VGAAFAASKMIGKFLNACDEMNVYAAEAGLSEIGDPTGATSGNKDTFENEEISLEGMGYDQSQVRDAGPQNEPDTGAGFSAESEGPDDDKTAARIAALEAANHVDALASKNAKTAAEMRVALSSGDAEFMLAMIEAIAGNPDDGILKAAADRKLFDSFSLLSPINIDPELALADSGQALIEQKLSKAEAM
jgi:hypothetical protein